MQERENIFLFTAIYEDGLDVASFVELRPTGFFEPSGVFVMCWGSKGGRESENNGIVLVALEV